MKRTIRNTLVAASAVLSLSLALTSSSVYAHEGHEHTESAESTIQQKKEAVRTEINDKKASVEKRLSETKLKVCEERESEITNTMTRMTDRGQKHIDLFSSIAERVQAFYVKKGNTLDTYESLVTAVNEAKATAQSAVDATNEKSTSFSCDGTDPKGAIEEYRAAMKTQIAAMKEYRTAVKNLIVGVKSVQSTTTENQSSKENE